MVSLGLAELIWEDKSVKVPSASNDISSFGLVSMLDYYTERCVTC